MPINVTYTQYLASIVLSREDCNLFKNQYTLKQTHIQMAHLSSATLNSNLTRTNNLFKQILKQFYKYVNPTFLE